MERIFGVSYPTIKARLNRIAGLLSSWIPTSHRPVLTCSTGSRAGDHAAEAISELEVLK